MDVDVLIVGAGPTGLMLANQLARRGVRFRLIDRHSGPARETRALGVQARTLEIYSQLGIAERAVELGKPGNGANLWAQGRKMARVPLGEAGRDHTPFPFILILGQDDTERLLGERLRDLGGAVEWNTELVGLEQTQTSATGTLKIGGRRTEQVTAAWIAGCDGARSSVRELNAIGFPGAPYEHVFYVADVQMRGDMVPDEVNVYLWREGFHLLFPMRDQDHWRVVGILPRSLAGREGVQFDDVIPSLHAEGAGLAFDGCTWFSTYRIHHRSAERFRRGRCFLLGDAAHIHSPLGAQGMNTGLQDAYNLAWKLALVVAGKAGESLIDSYEAERIPVARRLLATTDRGFRFVVSHGRLAGLLRTQVIARIAAVAMAQKRIQGFAFRTVSQLGIQYRSGPLSRTVGDWPRDAPQAGDRFPWLHLQFEAAGSREDSFRKLDDRHFLLLVFGQTLPSTAVADDLWTAREIPQTPENSAELVRARIPRPSYFLVRPDGYIGLCGTVVDPQALQRYMTRQLRFTGFQPA
jgi:2-polyprenyl-6-methoxyphenol hydroxylase-like FAD-dependent oxidoreductase